MRIASRIAAVGFTAALATTLFSTNAFATDYWWYTADSNPGGKAKFIENGDILEICDIEADGWGVSAEIYRNSDDALLMSGLSQAGNGTCTTVQKNISETIQIKIMVCLEKNAGAYQEYCNQYFVR